MTRRPMLIAVALFWLGAGLPWTAQAQQKHARQQHPLSGEHLEKFCEEEKRFTEPWIRWVEENRTICMTQTASTPDQAACLEAVRQQLDAHHAEHRAILLQEIRTLQPNHPVMQAILGRLRERERFAAMALETNVEHTRLVAARKESCLNNQP